MYIHGLSPTHKRIYTGITDVLRHDKSPGPARRNLEHFDDVIYEGRSLRAKMWKSYPYWTMFYLPVFLGKFDHVKRRDTFSHRAYHIPTVATSVSHRRAALPLEIGAGANKPVNMFTLNARALRGNHVVGTDSGSHGSRMQSGKLIAS